MEKVCLVDNAVEKERGPGHIHMARHDYNVLICM